MKEDIIDHSLRAFSTLAAFSLGVFFYNINNGVCLFIGLCLFFGAVVYGAYSFVKLLEDLT